MARTTACYIIIMGFLSAIRSPRGERIAPVWTDARVSDCLEPRQSLTLASVTATTQIDASTAHAAIDRPIDARVWVVWHGSCSLARRARG